ncbi:MAG: amidohydrolase family protein, partial [Kiloniellales bacterium]|nr:amidohydrolase family protein [Kiloniellales bacterium]
MSRNKDKRADCLLTGGAIYLGLAEGFSEALALADGRVIGAGTPQDLDGLVHSGTKRIDLAGRSAVPGFNDGHQHMLLYGLERMEVNLHPSQISSLFELQDRLRLKAETAAPGEWVVGRRYDHFHLDIGRHPTRSELDEAVPDHPCYITRTCGHIGVANSRALALAGIDESSENPPGGEIVRDDAGLTGALFETAQQLVKDVMPPLSSERMVAALEAAGREFLAQGITSVTDAGLGLRQSFDDFEAYRMARETGRLPLRVYLAMTGGPHGIEETARERGLTTGQGDERLKIGPVKLFADGSAGGKTAAMTLPYICACENFGLFVYEESELTELVEKYHKLGYQ